MKILKNKLVPKNYVAKDLRTSKYRMRVVESKVKYDRKSDKTIIQKELFYV